MSHIRACCKDDDLQNDFIIYENLVMSGSMNLKRTLTQLDGTEDDTDEVSISFSHDPITFSAFGVTITDSIQTCCGEGAEFTASGTMTRTSVRDTGSGPVTDVDVWELKKLYTAGIFYDFIQNPDGFAILFARIRFWAVRNEDVNNPVIVDFEYAFNANPNANPFASTSGVPPTGAPPGGFVPPWFIDTSGPFPATPAPTNAYDEPDLDINGDPYSKIAFFGQPGLFGSSLFSPSTVVLPFGQGRTETFESSASLSVSGIFRNEVPQDFPLYACGSTTSVGLSYRCP